MIARSTGKVPQPSGSTLPNTSSALAMPQHLWHGTFRDWRGDPDVRLSADGPTVAELLRDAAGRGVIVRGLIWRSHWDRFQFSGEENRHLGVDIDAAGGQCLLGSQAARPGRPAG